MSSLGGHVQFCLKNPNRRVYTSKVLTILTTPPKHNFLDNKYTRLYFKLLSKRYTSEYYEEHHIIPRSLGGTDDFDNRIKVTSRVHFLCHLLLTKMTTGTERSKMICAFMIMRVHNNNKRYINSRLFESYRISHSNVMKEMGIAEKNSQYNSVWVTNVSSGKSKRQHKYSVLEEGWVWGRCSKSKDERRADGEKSRAEYLLKVRNDTDKKYSEMAKIFADGEYISIEDFRQRKNIDVSYVSIIKGWKRALPILNNHIEHGKGFTSSQMRSILNA